MARKPTLTQLKVFIFACNYIDENDNFPTHDAIAKRFNYKSKNSAAEHIQRLIDKGLIVKHCGGYKRTTAGKRLFTDCQNSDRVEDFIGA